MVDYVWMGQARLTPYMAYQLQRLDADLRKNFGVGLVCNSGIRTNQEQIDIFLSRYVTAGNVKGRHVYDTRWWNGQLWYRVSAAGTVAPPGSSNHEIQGTTAAVDIQDTGATAGITSKNSERGRWIRANAPNYDMVASGDGFGEGWHFDIKNIFNAVPGQPAGGGGALNYAQEDSMIRIQATNRGIALIGPGYYRGLKDAEEVNNSGPLITPPGGTPWHYTGNDRQFDLWASMALQGRTPDTDQLNATRGDAQNAANIASEVRNWITDPDHGLVKLITNVGQVDSAMIAKAIQDALKDVDIDAEVDDETIAKIGEAAVDKLIERAKD